MNPRMAGSAQAHEVVRPVCSAPRHGKNVVHLLHGDQSAFFEAHLAERVRRRVHEDDVFENANEALCSMLPDLKYHVFQAIDEFDACVWMYSTVFGPPKKLFGEQKSYDIRSYEDFAKMVDEIYEDVGGEIEIAYGCFNRGWSLSD